MKKLYILFIFINILLKITDIHRESIDDLKIPSKRPGHPPLSRVPEVFDCWFESGSMPYAQMHYPFERVKDFEESFPADFIAEGIDQTRGWFYTLLVISTALFGKPPFKNLIANGLILASDGQKMSKRKKNYPDPIEVVNKYGADALRLYLINSPVVRAENLRFKEEGVRDVIKDVFLPWYNAFRFLTQNIERFEHEEKATFIYKEAKDSCQLSSNKMDRWILSFTETLLQFLKTEMQAYRLYTVVPRLIKYIDNLTNWYVRMNRRRIKGEGGKKDCEFALNTLFRVVYTMVRINAPFTPFLTEFMFQKLRKFLPAASNMDSIHYQMIPDACVELIDEKIEHAVSCMQTVIELGRVVRDRKTIPVKYPLPEIVVIHQDVNILNDVLSLKSYILEELNVKCLTLTTNKKEYGVKLRAEPDHKTLGARLKGEFKAVTSAIKELTDEELQTFVVNKEIEVMGHKLEEQDLRLMFSFTGPAAEELSKKYEAHSEGNVLILLDVTPDETMQNEGLARELINRVQKLRKKAKLVPLDEAIVYYKITDNNSTIAKIIVSHKDFIESTTKTPQKNISEKPASAKPIIEETMNIKGVDIHLALVCEKSYTKTNANQITTNNSSAIPFNKFVNVKLIGIKPRFGATNNIGTILLENVNSKIINFVQLKTEISKIFGIYGCHYDLFIEGKKINAETNMLSLNGALIHVIKTGETLANNAESIPKSPICRFINIENKENKGTVLLENPQENFTLNHDTLRETLRIIFPKSNFLLPPVSVLQLHGFTLQTKD